MSISFGKACSPSVSFKVFIASKGIGIRHSRKSLSEFSLIVVALGVSIGHVDASLLSTLTLTALITITLSTYLITYANDIFKILGPFLSIFD